MQKENAVRLPSWLERGAPALTGIAAFAAAAFYFVGWQYKQSLALIFGFASYPGDLSFQGTVATGVAVFDSMILPLVLLAFSSIYGALVLINEIPLALSLMLKRHKIKRVQLSRRLRKMQRQVKAETVYENDLVKLEKDVARLDWNVRVFGWLINTARLSPGFITVVIALVFTLTLVVLVYAGHLVAQIDAKAVRLQASGQCEGCFVYDIKPTSIVGVPLFQSADTIYVYRRRGLTRVRVDQVDSIRPSGKPRPNPLRLPRR
jgi:hypothetical protein